MVAGWLVIGMFSVVAHAQEDTGSDVELRTAIKDAISRGTAYLRRNQLSDGSWPIEYSRISEAKAGMTAIAVLAQINSDVPVKSKTLQNGLNYLRKLRIADLGPHSQVYEASLVIMALCAAEQYDRDMGAIRLWARLLQESQTTEGDASGLWSYVFRPGGGDRSNGQFAVLALRDAANVGVDIDQSVWRRTRDHWEEQQNPDGGWGYVPGRDPRGNPSRGSMTAAGLSTLAITSRMIADDADTDAEGRVDPCHLHHPPPALLKGRHYLGHRFSVRRNPDLNHWHYYYLYGCKLWRKYKSIVI